MFILQTLHTEMFIFIFIFEGEKDDWLVHLRYWIVSLKHRMCFLSLTNTFSLQYQAEFFT